MQHKESTKKRTTGSNKVQQSPNKNQSPNKVKKQTQQDRLGRKLFFLVLIIAFSTALYLRQQQEVRKFQVMILSVFSVMGYFAVLQLIPVIKSYCLAKGLWGKDINKNSDDQIPESLGIVVGTVYLTVVIMFQPFFSEMLGEYNAALTSICFMLFLGFADDVLDLRWAIKIFLSFLAVLPLLVAYSGPTNIIVPKPFRPILGYDLELGYLYHIYMALISVFCTNSINIYAGINGLESSQSLVISGAILVHNFIELLTSESHILSLFLILPFFATNSGLLFFNWYPSQVFVGDSFTYFSGMTLAVAGIMGKFSKTLMLFFAPQLLNFILSLPQLFGIVPCPKHRVPKFDPKTGKLYNSRNYTLINAFLFLFGDMHERTLTSCLVGFQILCCAIGFAVRYSHTVTNIFYDK